MKIKGVNDIEVDIIKGIISPYFEKYGFYFYGSRVRGDFRPLSDLDIMIKGKTPVCPDDFEALKKKLTFAGHGMGFLSLKPVWSTE